MFVPCFSQFFFFTYWGYLRSESYWWIRSISTRRREDGWLHSGSPFAAYSPWQWSTEGDSCAWCWKPEAAVRVASKLHFASFVSIGRWSVGCTSKCLVYATHSVHSPRSPMSTIPSIPIIWQNIGSSIKPKTPSPACRHSPSTAKSLFTNTYPPLTRWRTAWSRLNASAISVLGAWRFECTLHNLMRKLKDLNRHYSIPSSSKRIGMLLKISSIKKYG